MKTERTHHHASAFPTVVFDVGSVLCEDNLFDRATEMAKQHDVEQAGLLDFLRDYRILADVGVWSEYEFWRQMLLSAGINGAVESEFFQPLLRPIAETLQLADRLQRMGYRVGVVTNDSHELAGLRKSLILKHIRLPEPYIISAQEGVAKPSPVIYQRLVERVGIPPDQIVFVDDSRRNVEGARAVGIRAIQFDSVTTLESELGWP